MVNNDTLANALSKLNQYDKLGKGVCTIRPASKTIASVLGIMKKYGYIKSYDKNKDDIGSITVKLNGRINRCGVVKPRYPLKKDEYEKFEKRYLPSRDMGIMIVATVQDIMEHTKAKDKKIGGRLLAYCY